MEWKSCEVRCQNSLINRLGVNAEEANKIADDIQDTLEEIKNSIENDDPKTRETRRDLIHCDTILTHLVPVCKRTEDKPALFAVTIAILAHITVPFECLHKETDGDPLSTETVKQDYSVLAQQIKELCQDVEFVKIIGQQVSEILKKTGNSELDKKSAETLNNCLCIFRNLLILTAPEKDKSFLRLLFRTRFDEIILQITSHPSSIHLCRHAVQLISLFYKNAQKKPSVPCITLMDDTTSEKFETLTCPLTDCTRPVDGILHQFVSLCSVDETEGVQRSNDKRDRELDDYDRKQLTLFSWRFLRTSFSKMVLDLQNCLTSGTDDIYYLYLVWTMMHFLKLARTHKADFTYIKDVFKRDILSYLTYVGMTSCETYRTEVKNSKDSSSCSQTRLLMSIHALQSYLDTFVFYDSCLVVREHFWDVFQQLKEDFGEMISIRQFPLQLFSHFAPHINSLDILTSIVTLNHKILILLDLWNRHLPSSRFDMLHHIRNFATRRIINQYGRLLEKYDHNHPDVNNKILTMLSHVAIDCDKPKLLLQIPILNYFSDLSDMDYLSFSYRDLVDYILHLFMKEVHTNPYGCAAILLDLEQGGMDHLIKGSMQECERDICKPEESFCEQQNDSLTKTDNRVEDQRVTFYLECSDLSDLKDFATHPESDNDNDFLQNQTKMDCNNSTENEESDGTKSQSEALYQPLSSKIKILLEKSEKRNLAWIQNTLLEVCYIKLVSKNIVKESLPEEPVPKYSLRADKPVPIIPITDSQTDTLMDTNLFSILQLVGFDFGGCDSLSSGPYTPKIPNDWDVQKLWKIAGMFGPIQEASLKFHPSCVRKARETEKGDKVENYNTFML